MNRKKLQSWLVFLAIIGAVAGFVLMMLCGFLAWILGEPGWIIWQAGFGFAAVVLGIVAVVFEP